MEALKLLALATLAACGRLDFDPLARDATTIHDAPANCLGTGAFTAIAPVTAINDMAKQYGSFITPDGLALYYDQPFMNEERLFFATRPDRASAFGAGQLVDISNPPGNDSDASIRGDGLELYFDSDRGGTSQCLWRATRATVTDPWSDPARQDQLCATGQFVGPNISADGTTLVYSSSLNSAAEGDLYISFRADITTPFPDGTKLAGLPSDIGYPALSKDRLRIWFEHGIATDSLEIMSAQRISPSDNFTSAAPVAELNFGDSQGDMSLTLDESEIGFSVLIGGNYDVYTASRPCL